MTLSAYLRTTRTPYRALARAAGCAVSTVHAIAKGTKRAGPDLARRIEAATGGAVPATCHACGAALKGDE